MAIGCIKFFKDLISCAVQFTAIYKENRGNREKRGGGRMECSTATGGYMKLFKMFHNN